MNFKKHETVQKLRGGYYTEPDITAFLTGWVLETRPTTLLEPSCGDGAFFEAIARLPHPSLERVEACEIVPEEATKARRKGTKLKADKVSVITGDFLELAVSRVMEPPRFDAVVGNPPFIRYQYLEKRLQFMAEKLFAALNLRFTKHTNAWVSFVLASLAQLRPGGRLAMVVPAEILHVLHARSLRDFMLRSCSKVLILDPHSIWFADTLQGVVLLLAQKKEKVGRTPAEISVMSVEDRADLTNGNTSLLFKRAKYTCGSRMNGKWMLALLSRAEQSLLEQLERYDSIKRFLQVASVDVGIVTGANKFFLVPDSVVTEYGLEKWSHPMFGRSEHARGVIYDKRTHEGNRKRGLPTNFVWFGDESIESLPPSVQDYIHYGESQELHNRYKCRIRTPWYSVPSVYSTTVGMLKRSHNFPRLVLNQLKAYTTDTAYRIKPTGVSGANMVVSFVNSLTALSAELEGRHYGGGVLELVPSEIEKVLLPLGRYQRGDLAYLNRLIKSDTPAEDILTQQDETVLRPLGITEKECGTLFDAWLRLRCRRQRITHEVPV